MASAMSCSCCFHVANMNYGINLGLAHIAYSLWKLKLGKL